MKSKAHFITYASGNFVENALNFAASARRVGFQTSRTLGPRDLEQTKFAQEHSKILASPRGGGYWLWKPYLIREAVLALKPDEFLLYSDAGRSSYYQFSRFPERIFGNVRQNGYGFLVGATIGYHGNIGNWTKRDCLTIMNADCKEIHEKPMIQATWSLWSHTEEAISFLDDWLHYCEDARCLTDQLNVLGKDNLPGFVDHRHDQSICSILAHQRNVPFLDFSRTFVNRLIEMRRGSELGNTFYKRPQNCNDLLAADNPWLLLREFLKLRTLR